MTGSGTAPVAPVATAPGPCRTRAYRRGTLRSEDFPLAEELPLHELAAEDALGPHQRPKVDHYDTHLFVALHAMALDADGAQLSTSEVDAFAGDRWLVTVRKDQQFDLDPVLRRGWGAVAAVVVTVVAAALYLVFRRRGWL